MNTDHARARSADLASLLRREHHALGDFVAALADFDRGRGWEALGYASLFAYLHRELRLSKGAAQYRKVAAELVQAVPAVGEALRDGRLCVTSVIEVAKVVTPANWAEVLPRFYGLSRREAMEVVAALEPAPAPAVRTVVTTRFTAPAPAPAPAAGGRIERDEGGLFSAAPAAPAARAEPVLPIGTPPGAIGSTVELTPSEAAVAPTRPAPRAEVVPLTATARRLHVTVSARFLAKLRAAADALSHARPGASEEEILEAGLDLLLAAAAKRRGETTRPLAVPRPTRSGAVPAHVRREVFRRDGGRCAWPLESGGICGSTRRVELDHVVPRARGGESTAANLRCLCAAHNLLAARRALGDGLLDLYARRGATSRIAPEAAP